MKRHDRHDDARLYLTALEGIVDDLKQAGPHPTDGNNALRNIAERAEALAARARRAL